MNIPTAEEMHEKWFAEASICFVSGIAYDGPDLLAKYFQDFAKLHVKAALEAAAKNADMREYGEYGATCIDRDTILNAYPESNIK